MVGSCLIKLLKYILEFALKYGYRVDTARLLFLYYYESVLSIDLPSLTFVFTVGVLLMGGSLPTVLYLHYLVSRYMFWS